MGKRDKQILLGIAAVALVLMGIFYLMQRLSDGKNAYALVSIDGEPVMELELSKESDRQIDLSDYGVQVILEIKNHQIHFLSSDCPDQICVRFGMLDHEPQSAVCMPNRVAVTINSFSSLKLDTIRVVG